MTLFDRVTNYNRTWGTRFPASALVLTQEQKQAVFTGVWVLGNDYRNKSRLYGAYPPSYLNRVMALFPDVTRPEQLWHVFSGSVPLGPYYRIDVNPAHHPDVVSKVEDLPMAGLLPPRLILADPPYSSADAEKYGTPMINRRKVLAALGECVKQGAFLVWLDTVWPMHSKKQWRTCGRIALVRSTNHRVRLVSVFERQ